MYGRQINCRTCKSMSRQLKPCDPANLPDEFPYVTTRYSPPPDPPKGFVKIRSERVGVTEIALYRRDASLKTYGLSRFIFRTQVQHHGT